MRSRTGRERTRGTKQNQLTNKRKTTDTHTTHKNGHSPYRAVLSSSAPSFSLSLFSFHYLELQKKKKQKQKPSPLWASVCFCFLGRFCFLSPTGPSDRICGKEQKKRKKKTTAVPSTSFLRRPRDGVARHFCRPTAPVLECFFLFLRPALTVAVDHVLHCLFFLLFTPPAPPPLPPAQ